MKKVTIVIGACDECPFFSQHRFECSKDRKFKPVTEINIYEEVAAWCPLDNASEEEVESFLNDN